MSVRWGLTGGTICGLMNAAPWPRSAGAFSASVGAGLLSYNTLAKADFFTGKLYLRSFEGGSVRVCVAGAWISTSCCTFSSQLQPTTQPVQQIYQELCRHAKAHSKCTRTHTRTHTSSVRAVMSCPCTYTTSTHIASH